jgi:4-aminobutyrate aminotransferase / (S)-3-amino-2-methylpropionate transaminase / 5-aminovalerate transaminase
MQAASDFLPADTNVKDAPDRGFDARRRDAVPGCIVTLHDICVVEASGVHVKDSTGRSYIDLTGGLGVMLVGYGNRDIEAATIAQLRRLAHTSFPTMASEPYVALAEALARLVGAGGGQYQTFFVNSGAEAIDNVMKVASWVTGRNRFIGLEGGFHGRTIGSLALTARERPFKNGLTVPLADVARLPVSLACDARPGGDADVRMEQAIEEFAASHGGADTFAAMVVEPVIGEGGIFALSTAFMAAAERFCQRHGILFVADEIQCGLGRTGAWFASIAAGTNPDLVIVGKALGGGLPLAAIVGKASVLDKLHPGALGTTQGGNPVACAAGLALLEVIRRDGLLARAKTIGNITQRCLGHLHGHTRNDVTLELRVEGAMAALAFRVPAAPAQGASLVAEAMRLARERGILLLRGGLAGETIRMLPPLVIEEATLDEALSEIVSIIDIVLA